MRPVSLGLLLSLLLACGAAPLAAQEEPLVAGGEGVPVPKKTKHVQPVYPAEALAQGVRGIVILDIVVDAQGKVASTSVLRSVPGLDEAAIGAARQWEYEPSKVDGKPRSVRITVPITFSLALPKLVRQTGVPELRQGVTPAFPPSNQAGGAATIEVTLEADGRIGDAQLVAGEPPFSDALLAAIKTWRFAPPPDEAVVSFRIEAQFVPARGNEQRAVQLRATGLTRSETLAAGETEPAAPPPSAPPGPEPSTPAAGAPAPQTPAPQTPAPPTGTAPPSPDPSAPKPQEPVPGQPVPGQPVPGQPVPGQPVPGQPVPGQPVPGQPVPGQPVPGQPIPGQPEPRSPAPPPRTPSGPVPQPPAPIPAPQPPVAAEPESVPGGQAAPPVEVITAPAPAPPPESGISAVRDVTLESGVPELSRGRRPVPPPLARLNGTSGAVEVSFSVGAGGNTALQTASGPDVLRYAAEQTVTSWVFRRTRAERAYLTAVFRYEGDKASAVVRPQSAQPGPAAGADPSAAAPAPSVPTPEGSSPAVPAAPAGTPIVSAPASPTPSAPAAPKPTSPPPRP